MSDFLIIGQGLAGTIVAKQLLGHGCSVQILDTPEFSASRVASGLMNPVIGKRFTLSPDFLTQKILAEQQYRLVSDAYNSVNVLRYIHTYDEYQRWEKQSQFLIQKNAAQLLSHTPEQFPELYRHTNIPEQVVHIPNAARLQTTAFLEFYRNYFKALGILSEQTFTTNELTLHQDYCTYMGERYSHLIFCDGWRSAYHTLFEYVPTIHAKGEFINVHIPSVNASDFPVVISNGKYLAHIHNNIFRFGATYVWNFSDTTPSNESVAMLTTELAQLLTCPFTVETALAGVRPVVKDITPVVGQHKQWKNIYTINGLGSKGALLAPLMSKLLVDNILNGIPIPAKYNVTRFEQK